MALVDVQTIVTPATQFDGAIGQGRWSFQQYDKLPRGTDIVIDAMSYTEDANGMGPPTTAVAFLAILDETVPVSTRQVWARDDAMGGGLLNPVSDNAAKTFPGFRLPRDKDTGEWWAVICVTIDKAHEASASINWYLVPAVDGT